MPLNICTVLLMITNLKLKHNLSSHKLFAGFCWRSTKKKKTWPKVTILLLAWVLLLNEIRIASLNWWWKDRWTKFLLSLWNLKMEKAFKELSLPQQSINFKTTSFHQSRNRHYCFQWYHHFYFSTILLLRLRDVVRTYGNI